MKKRSASCFAGPASRKRRSWRAVDASQLPIEQDASFRADVVARVRRDIAAGAYETPEKWEAALDKLQRRLESE